MMLEECQLRQELAACYRLVHHFGWSDLILTHISARVPGAEHLFLINPYGLMFDEITASNLVKVDLNGRVVERSEYEVNPAGFMIHSAVHMARQDAKCVLHLHGKDGMAISASDEGLLPLNQMAMGIVGDLAYHEYCVTTVESVREQIASDLLDKNHLIMRNHGTMTVGETPAEAFMRAYWLEQSCAVQLRVLASSRKPHFPAADVVERIGLITKNGIKPVINDLIWPALKRMLDRQDPSYRA